MGNSILFLYEGETEGEFYKKVLDIYLSKIKLRRNYSNLKGVYNINKKVTSKIKSYLINKGYKDLNNIHVFIAFDREGPRTTETLLNIDKLNSAFINKKSRIKSINQIIATQDLESWFFNDLDGIYDYLGVPKKKRNYKLSKNTEATNNRILSNLFHKNNKHYQKGRRAHNFIDHLNLKLIIGNTPDLQNGITEIRSLGN